MTEVFIVGEDPVTQEILRRLIKDYAPNLVVKNTLPARGSEIEQNGELQQVLSELSCHLIV